jgi:alpha-1,2-mannosyltransferase
MRNEHFGICVVEYIAAAVLQVVHNSARPKDDLLRGADAYLAETAYEYAQKVAHALSLSAEERKDEIVLLQSQIGVFDVAIFQEQCSMSLN